MFIAQSCLTLCYPVDCSLPGSSIHGILQARILEWVAIPLSRGSFWLGDWTSVSCIAGRFFTIWATREAQEDELAALARKWTQASWAAGENSTAEPPMHFCWTYEQTGLKNLLLEHKLFIFTGLTVCVHIYFIYIHLYIERESLAKCSH